jgi:hypothetical protein
VATNSKRKRLNRDDIVELILDPDFNYDVSVCDQSDSDVFDSDEHDEEGQLVTSNRRVYKWGLTTKQTGWGAQDLDTNKDSESDRTLLPHTTPGTKAWRQQTDATSTRIHQFTGDKTGMRQNVTPHINKHSTPYSVFMLYFAAVITLVVEETNQYHRQYLDTLDNGPSSAPDITEFEMFLFLAIIVQMGLTYETI